MSIVYFPMLKHLLADNHMNEKSHNDCVVNKKCIQSSNELHQNLSGFQIYPRCAQSSESEISS